MIFIKSVIFCAIAVFVQNAVGEAPKFRILAPPFVCPKDKNAVIDKPDNTIITLQKEPGLEVEFNWTVRWYPLLEPSQRFTVALWRTVRELERKLNGPQIEPNVYIINNTELLTGVNYIFNVTAYFPGDDEVTEKVFHINNIDGDHELLIEGRSDMFAITLVGGQSTYLDMEFTLEAQVTTCYKTHDYYFVWSVESSREKVEVSSVKGSRLKIRSNTLIPGRSYDVLTQVFKFSNGDFITQASLPFRVLHRDLEVNFNVDMLVISVETPFSLKTDINNLDYIEDGMTVSWECTLGGEAIDTFYETDDDGTLSFPGGLLDVGEYLIVVRVSVLSQAPIAKAVARIITVEEPLPVIEVRHTPRLLNEGSVITLEANVTNMTPGCSMMWYFTREECMSSMNVTDCGDNEHGTSISSVVNFYSLEVNFLSELSDYTNETGSKSMVADMEAATGRARLVVQCHCDKVNCTNKGSVYADVNYRINEKPGAGNVLVMPESGTAMETVFRLSTLAIVDPNRPLRYTFYCELNDNDTLILESYLEHLAVETLLPYIVGGTNVWVEVCDSLGACSSGDRTLVEISPGDARTLDALLEDARAHVRRCEIMMLRSLASSAIVTYINADQKEALNKFTSNLLVSLKDIDEGCVKDNFADLSAFLYWLAGTGVDTTGLM